MKTRITILLSFCSFLSIVGHAQTGNSADQKAKMEFTESEYDFGKINSGDIVTHIFKFTNTGEYPLAITDAQGSCGCTIPSYPKVPILPGESSEIEVTFNSTGKAGPQTKRVTITANTEPPQTILMITGDVTPPGVVFLPEDEKVAEQEKTNAVQKMQALDPNCYALFPNPTNNILQLELKEQIGMSATVDIHNDKGEKILSKTIDRISRETTQFDVSNYAPGTYLISIRVDNLQPFTQCFVVAGK